MFDTVSFEDVTFGLFPLTGGTMDDAFGVWPQNSAGDVVDMILQALEVGHRLHDVKQRIKTNNISRDLSSYTISRLLTGCVLNIYGLHPSYAHASTHL